MAVRKLGLTLLIGLAAVFCASGTLAALNPSGLLEIHQINVGQGQATLIIGPDGTTVLMDAGRNGQGVNIMDYFNFIGLLPADGLDYTIAGHLDSDHVGGFDEVIQGGYDVRWGNWYNGSTKETQSISDYKAAAAGTTAGGPDPALVGDTIDLGGGALLTVVAVHGEVIGFGPVSGATANENDLSIAVLIEYGDFDYIWASDLGGGDDDNACTGRSTGQVNVETPLAQSLTPEGGFPVLTSAGVDVMTINHHGSESSTNSDYMNLLAPEVALIPVGEGQGSNWHHPRIDVVDNVLMAQAFCVSATAALVLQTEEGDPTGSQTSFSGFAVGDIKISTDGVSNYLVEATGAVAVGPDERAAAGLPRTMPLDESGGGNAAPSVVINAPANGSSFESGTLVTFTGTASDPEDGDLTAGLSWSSDLDGAIGSGGSFSIDTLSVGNHTITASVTDSGGMTGQSSIGVTVFVPGGGGGLVLSEVLYDVSSDDDGFEWVELYNNGNSPVDLSGYSLGNGGTDYTYSKVQLSGTIASGATFVVGGPTSSATNGSPAFDLVVNFSPDFQNSGSTADGVALFDVPAAQVNGSTVPIDAVVYGSVNSNGLIDETGTANAPEVGDAPANSSIERTDLAGSWQIQSAPTPNSTNLPPPSGGNTNPSVSITAPLDGASFNQGAVITFTGSATDTEDGDRTAGLSWTSDLDGAIGAGGSFTATLSVGTHTVTASVTDSGGLSGSDAITVLVNGPPSATISAPADGTSVDEGTSVTFTGSASDSEDGDLTASLSWSSSLDGAVGSGGSFSIGTLSVGTHTITASVTDSGGLSGSDAITLTVNAVNTAPTVSITAPADGTSVDEGTSVTFTGSASDTEDGDLTASLNWSSSLDGVIGSGGSFSTSALSVGTHTITASVTDSGGLSGSDAITVTVNSTNTAPTVTITAPADGTSVDEGTSVTFTGSASDAEDGDLTASISWSSSLDGAIGSGGSFSSSTLSVGTHTITATVTDSGGLSGSDSVTLTVNAVNTPPTITISAPADGTSVDEGTSVTFTGSASDAEDGDLTASISWSSSLDGAIGSGGSFSTATLSVGTHSITASVTDSGGSSGSDSITVTVNSAGQPVTITLTSLGPEDGWVRESNENSGVGGKTNASGTGNRAIRIGDDNRDRQLESILSFDTSVIPDGATIVSATIRLRRGRLTGGDPFATHGFARVDVQSGGFSGSTALENADFEATATAPAAAILTAPAADGDWSEGVLDAAGRGAIHTTGTTQFRIAFDLDDNDDGGNDYMGYYSGDDGNPANHPELVVTYQP